MSLGKLRKYITAYNLKIDRVVEKDDLIDAIIGARVRCFGDLFDSSSLDILGIQRLCVESE